MDFPKQYLPKNFEADIYRQWKDEKTFEPQPPRTKQSFYIPIPPPNVTGNLHIGHALTLTIEDIMTRYHRMRGDATIWIPGTDHAGIATQAKVEDKIRKLGKDRVEMGRESFLDECWKWMKEYRGNISGQIEKMGASVDWSRERFTFDTQSNELVEGIFVDLYQKWLLYRGEYMVNYSPALDSVISDIEVDYRELDEKMYYVNYFVSGLDEEIPVATTRPETMLADMAVAVHPRDRRYKSLIGRKVLIPIINREIPVIGDDRVDMTFWTGAVKITPAHDPTDFEMAKRHNIRTDYQVIDKKWYMTAEAGIFAGQQATEEARSNIVELLRSRGNLIKVEPYTHKVGFCSRGGCRIESVVSTQWFIRASKMAEKVIAGYKKKDFMIVPSRFEKSFEDWIYHLRDWCISRQLWWGHQIPAYYDTQTGEMLWVTRNPTGIYLKQCEKYGKIPNQEVLSRLSEKSPPTPPHRRATLGSSQVGVDLTQQDAFSEVFLKRDEDVLDTWFSAATWPFNIVDFSLDGDHGELFRQFYPASVLETGYDILFFWVIRMFLFGYEYTGGTPFKTIYLHGLVLDSGGRKMSKSWGNVVNPLDVIETHSADALRLALILGNTPGNNLNFSMDRVSEETLFLNKLWNIARFVSMNVGQIDTDLDSLRTTLLENKRSLLSYERWILSRLAGLVDRVTAGMDGFIFAMTGGELMAFIREEFADFTIEAYKLEKDRSKYGKEVLSLVLTTLLKLAHPYIPFITEALYQQITGGSRLIISEWPDMSGWKIETTLEQDMRLLFDTVRTIRNLRAESKIKPSDLRQVHIVGVISPILTKNRELIAGLTRTSEIIFSEKPTDTTTYAYATLRDIDIYVDAAIDESRVAEERSRLMTEIMDKKEYLRGISLKLSNPSFVSNAPEKVVRAEMEKQKLIEDQIEKLEAKYRAL